MNIKNIPEPLLNAVRLRLLGTTDLTESTVDKHIETLTSRQLIEKYSGWYFVNDEQDATKLIDFYDQLKQVEDNIHLCPCGGVIKFTNAYNPTLGGHKTFICTKCGLTYSPIKLETQHIETQNKLNNIRTWAKGLQSLSDKNSTEYSIFSKLIKMIDV